MAKSKLSTDTTNQIPEEELLEKADVELSDMIQQIKSTARVNSVSLNLGVTINLGNYESARVDVGLDLSAGIEIEDQVLLKQTLYTAAKDFCVDKLKQEVSALKAKKSKGAN